MIQTFSSTIRRKEMDAVLTCMVDEKIGPGELNTRLTQTVKEFIGCDGCVALRSPAVALDYALKALDLEKGSKVMISALAPVWHYTSVKSLGYEPLVLDVEEETGLISYEKIENGMKEGGRVLILFEAMGIIPEDIEKIVESGLLVIEDISHSAGAVFDKSDVSVEQSEAVSGVSNNSEKKSDVVKAGMFGTFSIMGLEERDTITAGGGAVLIAPRRREWIVLKRWTDEAPSVDVLPDINCALAFVQIKEFKRNEESRKNLFKAYLSSIMRGQNKTFPRENDDGSTIWSFPVVLNSAFKDVKQYTAKKDIEIALAYENSVIAKFEEELSEKNVSCIHAKSLALRCVLFPLYPRLTSSNAEKIVKVLGTLP